MSNWIDSGGDAPRQFCDAYMSEIKTNRKTARRKMSLQIVCALLLSASVATSMRARDVDGRYAAQNPELHQWFEGLRSGKGPCCSDADGSAVSDVDWETSGGHYRVRIDISVPGATRTTASPSVVPSTEWPPAAMTTYCSPFHR